MLDGTLDLRLGDGDFRLEAGDCLMMRFGQPLLFRNPAARPVRYAIVISHGAARL